MVPYLKRLLELWIPLDRFRHREIVQFVCGHDAPGRAKRAARLIVDEQLVVRVNIGRGDIVGPNEPVERVILPDDSGQVQCMCNIANTVLTSNVGQHRSSRRDRERGTYINIAIRRTPTSRCDAGDKLDGLNLKQ